jgi:putative PIN family toxin of toxin-antitoxin system
MKLVIDTNIIMSALIKNGATRKLIMTYPLEFCTPEHVFEEIEKHKEYLSKKANMNKEEISALLEILRERIEIVPQQKIKQGMKQARRTMEKIDENDSPILSCALTTKNQGIWTEDKHFKKQSNTKTWTTSELYKIFYKDK